MVIGSSHLREALQPLKSNTRDPEIQRRQALFPRVGNVCYLECLSLSHGLYIYIRQSTAEHRGMVTKAAIYDLVLVPSAM